jgi:hypothetical protein
MTTTTDSTTIDLSACPCCGSPIPCDGGACVYCDDQKRTVRIQFAGVVNVDSCGNDVAAFWNDTSFLFSSCCACECSQSQYIPDPDDDYFMGNLYLRYAATEVEVEVQESGTDITYSPCPGADSGAVWRETGLVAPYDCENRTPSLVSNTLGRADWSAATCAITG